MPPILHHKGNQWTTRSLRVTLANSRMCGWRRLDVVRLIRELLYDAV
jgi:hypothetical protein